MHIDTPSFGWLLVEWPRKPKVMAEMPNRIFRTITGEIPIFFQRKCTRRCVLSYSALRWVGSDVLLPVHGGNRRVLPPRHGPQFKVRAIFFDEWALCLSVWPLGLARPKSRQSMKFFKKFARASHVNHPAIPPSRVIPTSTSTWSVPFYNSPVRLCSRQWTKTTEIYCEDMTSPSRILPRQITNLPSNLSYLPLS